MNKISNKRRANDRPPHLQSQLPDFPLWQGVPRMVPPPLGPARLPLVPAEPPPAALSTAQVAGTASATGLAAATGLAPGPSTSTSPSTAWYSPAPIRSANPAANSAANLSPTYRRPPIHATPPPHPHPPRPAPLPFVRTAILLGLALLAAAATYTALHRASSPAPTVDPFAEAVSALANEPVIHYVSTQADIYVTADGEEVGTSTRGGQRVNILLVGGAMYYEPVDLQNAWTPTPNDLNTPPPSALAAELRSALPTITTHEQPTSLNGVPALAADTSAGELYVSATSPYRVLRIGSLTLAPMTAAEDKQVYSQVIKDVRHLAAE